MNIIEFTIKNLDLRIERATQALSMNEMSLTFAKRDKNAGKIAEHTEKIKTLKKNITGYNKAKDKLQSNAKITKSNADYIIKGLNIRQKRLNENLEMCQNAIRTEKRALETKQDTTMSIGGGLGVTIKHYDDVSISIIEKSEERVAKITNSLKLCENALGFFNGYLK
jgi:chromosome segregation ATPase